MCEGIGKVICVLFDFVVKIVCVICEDGSEEEIFFEDVLVGDYL